MNMTPGDSLMFADFNSRIGSVIGGHGIGLRPTVLIVKERAGFPADALRHAFG
jgi:hypothetical protein